LTQLSDEAIIKYKISTAWLLVFKFDELLKLLKNYYIYDENTFKARMQAVADQGKAKM
jgi:2,3-bisphosphoglycerate-dependent phosphoglycerate mutase